METTQNRMDTLLRKMAKVTKMSSVIFCRPQAMVRYLRFGLVHFYTISMYCHLKLLRCHSISRLMRAERILPSCNA
uniref:Uncharacterized protein n=1 Tax=Ciona intestinalis TaxID=7719 RepID=F6QHQ6_CIOIN